MGTPVPPEMPDLENGKYYCVTVDVYKWDPDTDTCWELKGRDSCCRTGSQIKTLNYGDCPEYEKLCMYSGVGSTRLICIKGPFDTQAACLSYCV